MKVIGILLAVVFLSGCFPATRGELRETAAARDEFTVQEGYQSAYRKIVSRMQRCNESMWIGDAVSVRSDLYTDIGHGEIAIEGSNMLLGKRVQLLIDVADAGSGTARVSVYQPINKKMLHDVRKWIATPADDCS